MNISFHKKFVKSYQKLPYKLQQVVDEKVELFMQTPLHPELRNHQLKGKYSMYRSIDVTGDYRALYMVVSEEALIFVKLGTHSQLYA